ncbi:MAG: hypothetical protein GY790_24510 [Bacteroidetes bacterium]|nr:hypothetical protein [Bacteroidota bacterium]
MRKIFIIMLCCTLLTSCPSPYHPFKRGEKPRHEDIVGVYLPTSATIRRLKKEGYQVEREILVELQDNGIFIVTNMPDLWQTDWADPKGGYDSGSGTWELTKSQSVWVIPMSFEAMNEHSTNNLLNYNIYNAVHILNAKPPYGLAIALMAGDDGYLWFEKVVVLNKE